MNDDALLAEVRDSLAEVRDSLAEAHPSIPASEIIARASRRRRRRGLASAGAALAAIGLTLALALPSGSQARPVHVHLAAWSVDTHPNGTVTFNLRQVTQPARLQHVLTEAGVPASVRWGKICLAQGRHVLLPTEGFVKFSPSKTWKDQPASFFGVTGPAKGGQLLYWSWTINPAKIPSGARFMISAVSPDRIRRNDYQAVWEFVPKSAPVACARFVKS
jgi:hypothetical protein